MIKVIKNMLAKKAIKKVVKLVSKNNPYALAAVELYGLYDMINRSSENEETSKKNQKGESDGRSKKQTK